MLICIKTKINFEEKLIVVIVQIVITCNLGKWTLLSSGGSLKIFKILNIEITALKRGVFIDILILNNFSL